MILADIGNRHLHIWEKGHISHLSLMDAIERYGAQEVAYISVSSAYSSTLAALDGWQDISETIHIEGEYPGMGVDRRALCLSRESALFVDAGSAITIDSVVDGVYQGGCILPGLHAYAGAYAEISPALAYPLREDLSLECLPKSTQDAISYGAIYSIVATIARLRGRLPLYFTGGDGKMLSGYFDDAHFEEGLVFEGIQKSLERSQPC